MRRQENNQTGWATISGKRTFIAKRTISIMKMTYVIFFTTYDPVIPVRFEKHINYINATIFKTNVFGN
jgi:hypothetical protein